MLSSPIKSDQKRAEGGGGGGGGGLDREQQIFHFSFRERATSL